MDLLAKINVVPYHQVISLLNYGDTVSEEDFENHPVSKFFWLDLRECFLKNKNRDPDNLFTLFGNYSLDNADTVRQKLTKHMEEDVAYYDSVACVALSFKNVTMKYWIEDMSEALTFGYEICLYALCRMYDRHAMVYTQTKAWSTMAMIKPSHYLNAIAKCDIHLLHMGRGIYGRLKRKPLVVFPSNIFTHPKIHVKIDRRRKTSRVEDLRCPDKRIHETWCEGEEYLEYESDGSHCLHKNNDQVCTKLHSDTETDSSLASLIAQTNWTDDDINKLSEISDHGDENNSGETENQPEPCPVHGVVTEPIENVTVRNTKTHTADVVKEDVPSLCDLVKTYLLSSNYPEVIDLPMINRFCNVPLKLLQVKLVPTANQEMQKPKLTRENTLELKKCIIRLTRISVDICEPNTSSANKEISDTNSPSEDTVHIDDQSRPKRKVTENKNYIESNSDIDESTDPTPTKLKREPNPLSSPSAARIAAQRRSRRIAGLSASTPKPKVEPPTSKTPPNLPNPEGSGNLAKIPAYKLPPKKRPRNTREKHTNGIATLTTQKPVSTSTNTKIKSNTDDDANTVRCNVNIAFKGLPKHKKIRKFTCTVCKFKCDTQAGFNSHHIKNHAPVVCNTCQKQFLTPSTLARHRYSHTSLKFKCDTCGQQFPFKSALDRHGLSHRTYAAFVCHHKDCGRSYFSNGELLKHIKVHEGKTWHCPEDNCDYSTKDKRLLGQHGRKHSDAKPYVCGVCGKGHKYHVQYVRHVENDNCEATNVP